LVLCAFGPNKRGARFFRPPAPHCDSRNHQLVESPRRGWEKTRIEVSEHTLRLIELSDQKESPDFKIARKSSVQPVAALRELTHAR
jgi:hypothetical protein